MPLATPAVDAAGTPPVAPLGETDGAAEGIPWQEVGIASWYGRDHQGRRTASGTRFDRRALTAAHPYLPFGTSVRVENLVDGTSVVVRITDRGPFVGARIIDLSEFAANRIGLAKRGIGQVRLSVASAVVEP